MSAFNDKMRLGPKKKTIFANFMYRTTLISFMQEIFWGILEILGFKVKRAIGQEVGILNVLLIKTGKQ